MDKRRISEFTMYMSLKRTAAVEPAKPGAKPGAKPAAAPAKKG